MAPQWTRLNSGRGISKIRKQCTRGDGHTVKGVKVPPRFPGRRPHKDPSLIPQHIGVQAADRQYNNVKEDGNRDDEAREEELGRHPGLAAKQDDGQNEWNQPERDGIGLHESLQSVEVVFKAPVHPRRHLEASGDEEPANATDTADQNVAGDEADDVPKLELAHQVEDGAGQHRTQRVGGDGRSNHGVWAVVAHNSGDCHGHAVEEGDNFDLEVQCQCLFSDVGTRGDLQARSRHRP